MGHPVKKCISQLQHFVFADTAKSTNAVHVTGVVMIPVKIKYIQLILDLNCTATTLVSCAIFYGPTCKKAAFPS